MPEPRKPVRLVDATLRDGSYCVDFQFTAADTAILVGMLDAAGVEFLELGHGSGSFHHLAPPHIRARVRQAAPDEEYFAVARRCAKRAKLGIITGPFGYDHLHVLAEHRLDFLRLACMADRALDAANIKVAERAKALGLVFSVNLMQTTAISPARLADVAAEYARVGIDWLYIVDSSGGLLPRAVTEYVSRVRDSGLTIGFHAHHNSGLAVANCLAAIEAGATLVDGTLQGLGRDVGNAPTEQLLFLLQRLGHEREIDVEQVSHAGDLVRHLLEQGNDATYFAAGASEIHSSNVEALVRLAREKGLGARSLVAAVGHGDVKLIGDGMKTFPEDVIGPACARATREVAPVPSRELVQALADDIARASTRSLPVLADVVFARAAKQHARAVLHLVPASELSFAGPLPWQLDGLCGITVGVDPAELEHELALGLGLGDRPVLVVVDPMFAGRFPRAIVDAFAPIVVDATLAVAATAARSGRAFVACTHAALAAQLTARGATPLTPQTEVTAADVVVVVDREVPPHVAALARGGTRLLRPFLAKTVAARVAVLVELEARLGTAITGELVDPLHVPGEAQCVVDDPACPTTIVGHASREQLVAAALARASSLLRGRGQL